MSLLLEQLLNGFQEGVMLFLIAAGLTLVLGVMNFVNLAHASFYMLGAYLSVTFQRWMGFFPAALLAILGSAAAGAILEATIIRRLYTRTHLDQVLCTFGILFVANDATRMIWGVRALQSVIPPSLSGAVDLLPGMAYPVYRLLIIAVSLLAAGFLQFLIMRTRIGMLIRAGAADRDMVGALGADIGTVYLAIFALGAALAALAGLMAGPLFSVTVGMGDNLLILALVVIVIGGVGSVRGAFVAAVVVGLMDTLGRFLLPPVLATIIIYVLMAAVLFIRPSGLFGADATSVPEPTDARARQAARPRRNLIPALIFVLIAALALVPPVAHLLDQPFAITMVTLLLILGLAALSLDLILGAAGMVSFGHAAFIGIGAYVTAILGWSLANDTPISLGFLDLPGTNNPLISWPLSILAASLAALVIGAASLRTSGLGFLMITLAFAQMLFYVASTPGTYGGEDGLPLSRHMQIVTDRTWLYYVVLAALALVLVLALRLMRSRFGMVLQACRQNPRRLAAIGISPYRYKLLAFVLAGAVAGLAGVLLANAMLFVSPFDMSWLRSGDLIIMAGIGGPGTLVGPVLGTITYETLQFVLSDVTDHWQVFFGAALILFVLTGRRGLVVRPRTM